jgi:hypothetical protein
MLRFLLIALFLLGAPAIAQENKLPPVDEAAQDPSWVSFKNRLLNALDRRDRKFVLSVLDRNIRNGFEGERGIAEFRRQWNFDADDSPLWRELPALLFLGGAYVRREKGPAEFCAPYVLPKWPDDVDPYVHGAVVSKDVLVKSAPSASSSTLQTLAYDIVSVSDWDIADESADARQRWVKIRVKERDGYVPEEQIRSPVEHAACFVKTAGGWRMTALVVGGG